MAKLLTPFRTYGRRRIQKPVRASSEKCWAHSKSIRLLAVRWIWRTWNAGALYAVGWPDSWRKFYVGSGLVRRDPLVDALARRHAPFTWSDLRRDPKLSTVGSAALQLCAEHGWTEGLAVPIPRGDQRFGLVSPACQRRHFDASEKALLAMLSICFLERLRNLAPTHGFAMPPAGLIRREIDCLKLIARGATDREIGRKLGISQSTAHEHCESAKKKLKISSRAEAIAIAVSLAVVAP